MTKRIKWTDRRFDFTFPAALYPEMIERVRGTPARLEDRIGSLPPAILQRRDGGKWSIQENAGHLLDLEPLVMERLNQYLAGVTELHAADMSNRKTHEADHNNVPVASILHDFREQRTKIVARLDGLDAEMFVRSALHPRLAVQMRLVDMIFFQAEHDDFHLTRISELVRLFAS
ncbi:MAG: DinB family protein [Pyrinomonadaceae bacterium]|nr:DinB family protein [Pyrinomonadaceae bacterium]